MSIQRTGCLALVVAVIAALPATAHPHPSPPDTERHLLEILEGIEHGLVALEQLQRHEEHRMLQRVAEDVRREVRGARGEREAMGRDREREVAWEHSRTEACRHAHEERRDGEDRWSMNRQAGDHRPQYGADAEPQPQTQDTAEGRERRRLGEEDHLNLAPGGADRPDHVSGLGVNRYS